VLHGRGLLVAVLPKLLLHTGRGLLETQRLLLLESVACKDNSSESSESKGSTVESVPASETLSKLRSFGDARWSNVCNSGGVFT